MTYSTSVGARPPARRGRVAVRRTLTVLVVLLIFGGIGYTVWTTFLFPASSPADATACPTPPPATLPLPPRRIQVNVYNATSRTGLARRTAKQLASYGFRIGKIDNDPMRRRVLGPGEIRGGPGATRQIAVLREYLDSAAVVRDKRRGGTVDLVLGTKFTKLSGPAIPAAHAGASCT